MNFQGSDIVFLAVVCLATYAYSVFIFSKEPDPSTEFGISLNAMMAFLVTLGASLIACAFVLTIGILGYAIVIVVYPFLCFFVPKIVRKIIGRNGNATV